MCPIKRYEQALANEAPRYPYIGKLRKGAPKGENRPGRELEWFRFTSEIPGLAEVFAEIYGDQPATFEITLPHGTPRTNWEAWCEEWSDGGILKHRCDGEKCVVWYDSNGVYHTAAAGAGPDCPGGCSEVLRMSVMLPALAENGHVGLVTIETHSSHDIASIPRYIQKAYDDICHYGESMGRKMDCRDILFTVRRVPQMISSPVGGKKNPAKRGMVKHYLVQIVPAASWIKRQMAVIEEIQAAPVVPLLQSPDWEDVTSGGRPVVEVEKERPQRRPQVIPTLEEVQAEEVEGEVVEETPAPAPQKNGNGQLPHWAADSVNKRRFLNALYNRAIFDGDICKALKIPDIDHLTDFPGTGDDALKAVLAWVDQNIEESRPVSDEVFEEVPVNA